jgi:hypothetical protein
MKNKMIVIMTAVMLAAGASRAAHVWEDPSGWWSGVWVTEVSTPKYTCNELSMDFFGSYINGEQGLHDLFNTNIRRGFWGGGVGINYFFLEQLGAGVDFNVSDKPNFRLVDDVVGDLIFRWPICNSGVAPYLIGSGGRGISPIYQWVYGGGVGLEYRFNPSLGLFGDARFLWAEKGDSFNRLLIRFGIRFVF